MSFQFERDPSAAPSSVTPQQQLDEPLLPYCPYTEEDLPRRAFGHPLGTDPESPDIVDKVFKYGLDPLGKALGVALPIAERVAPTLARETGEIVEHAGSALGPVGVGISVLGAANETRKLVQTVAEDGPNAIHDQRFYNAEAGVMSNSTHALLGAGGMIPSPAAPFLKGADLAISALELGTDMVGGASAALFGKNAGFDSNSVEGGLIRGLEGDRSLGYQAGEWTRDKLGPGTGSALAATAVNFLTNQLAMPINLANAAYRGITSETQAAQDGIANGEGLMGWDDKHGLNPLALPKDNPLLMSLGLGTKHDHPLQAKIGGEVSLPRAQAAEGVGGGPARKRAHPGTVGGGIAAMIQKPPMLAAGLGGGIAPGLLSRHRRRG